MQDFFLDGGERPGVLLEGGERPAVLLEGTPHWNGNERPSIQRCDVGPRWSCEGGPGWESLNLDAGPRWKLQDGPGWIHFGPPEGGGSPLLFGPPEGGHLYFFGPLEINGMLH